MLCTVTCNSLIGVEFKLSDGRFLRLRGGQSACGFDLPDKDVERVSADPRVTVAPCEKVPLRTKELARGRA